MYRKFSISLIIFLLIVALGLAAGYFFRAEIIRKFYAPTETSLEQMETDIASDNQTSENDKKDIEVIADNLRVPWEIVFLPDGDLLVSERSGSIKKICPSTGGQAGKEIRSYVIEDVEHIGEGGLLGMALHPDFAENHFVYLYLTTKTSQGLRNRVERYLFEEDRFLEKTIIVSDIPADANHNGGRIAFSPASAKATAGKPDWHLYITTGDAGQSGLAQDVNSLAGKILRLNDDGSIPADNPFGNAVYSFGHRNPQGLAWDDDGQLWETEHGRSGILSGFDELNLIGKGKNYGWPIIQGDETKAGMESPVVQSGADETWAPAGAAFWNGSIFFGGLRGESLYQVKIINNNQVSLKAHFRQEFGRIRAVVVGPDDYLYLTTSNTDGRGKPRAGDDKIIRVNPNGIVNEIVSEEPKVEQKPDEVVNEKVLLIVPFTAQAPFGNWEDARQEHGCEEAAILMAMYWVYNKDLSPEKAEQEIIAISDFEQKNYGNFYDTSTLDTLKVLKTYFGYKNAFAKFDIGIADIKTELALGNVVIVPIDGTKVNNPYYTQPGPTKHQMVIRGYDDATQEFITNDPGTKRGEGYRYNYAVLENALLDYPSGMDEPIKQKRTAMIVVKK